MKAVLSVNELDLGQIPEPITPSCYFNFLSHAFAHQAIFQGPDAATVFHVIRRIGTYCQSWLDNESKQMAKYRTLEVGPACVAEGKFRVLGGGGGVFKPAGIVGRAHGRPGTLMLGRNVRVLGATFLLEGGDIYIGSDSSLLPGSCIGGPAVLGPENEIRPGGFFRGNVITGKSCTFRGEAKNSVFLDCADFPHPSYVGDSLMGYGSHFGNGATTSNYGLFNAMFPHKEPATLVVEIAGQVYDTGMRKLGAIIGDRGQVGCGSVTDPGVFCGPRTLIYPLCRIRKGFYGPDQIIKNKPLQKGVLEITPLEVRDGI